MKLIIRADDFGLSEAVNYGVMKAFRGGLVKNIGLMSNMPYAQHAYDLIKGKDVALGLHVNLILGTPCAEAAQLSSLLDEQGQLLSSRLRRQEMKQGIDGFVYEDVFCETKAQIERFISICGNCRTILMHMQFVHRSQKGQSVMWQTSMLSMCGDIAGMHAGRRFKRILLMRTFTGRSCPL